MLNPTCSPLGARNRILANLIILARFCQILSYSFTLKVTSPPILTRSVDAHTYTLTTYWRNRSLWKEVYFHYGALKKSRSFFKGVGAARFKKWGAWGELAPILGVWAGAGAATKVMECIKPWLSVYKMDNLSSNLGWDCLYFT